MSQVRKSLDEQIAHLERVWEDFRTLKVGDLKPEDSVFHELQDRFGMYFEAYMGAEAIKKRLLAFDLVTESETCTCRSPRARARRRSARSSA
jgi:DNA-directed RNA polymerase subunit beta'